MKRSKFSLSHYKLMSFNMGPLYPITWFEVLPGDSIQMATQGIVRASPLLAPVMHPVYTTIKYYFVPFRLIWEDFEDFITGGDDGMDASVFPTATVPCGVHSLGDYLGLPDTTSHTIITNVLPFRAYTLIYNECIRNTHVQDPLPLSIASGSDLTTNTGKVSDNWDRDYFTSALPYPQTGPTISVPIGSDFSTVQMRANSDPLNDRDLRAAAGTEALFLTGANLGADTAVKFGTNTGLVARLEALREAFAIQRFEEARARYGTRYIEYLRYLGVRPGDARLQRPEYLGGGRETVQFSEVLQTAEGEDPVGDLKGHGIAAMRSNRFRRHFDEHGLVMALMSVKPKGMYTQGGQRFWRKRTKEDFWQKELENLGMQEITSGEVNLAGSDDQGVFGYQDRYEEYRRGLDGIAGEFRTSALDYWHFARDFGTDSPTLNDAFVSCLPVETPFAVPTQDVMYGMFNHSIQARRLVGSGGTSFVR